MRLGFLGPYGTFSQQAAQMYIQTTAYKDVDFIQYQSIGELITAVDHQEVDEAVVPIENSIEGPVNITLDMLAWDVELKIKREVVVPIEHCLMKKKDSQDIKEILSHPQAIGQCRKFLSQHFSNVPVHYTSSTAEAAQIVTKSKQALAAIAAKSAAAEYNLEVVYESIQDNKNNVTRFIVLSHEDEIANDYTKTSIIFSTQNKPGSLYRVLDILNLWDINMTRIESRPAKYQLGQYIFFVDIEGHREEEDIKDALKMIQRKTSFFKMLGSYPVLKDKNNI